MADGPVVVAVVSWNTRDLLASCLDSLEPEVDAGRAAVWVVDNASEDGSPQLVEQRYPWARLIASSENVGFGAAVNLVAREATAEWIAPANADIGLEPGALERMLAAGEADPEAAAIAPRLISPNGSTQHSVFSFPTVPLTFLYNLGVHRVSRRLADRWCVEGRWNPDRGRRVPWAVAAFLLVRRNAFDEIGGFDESQWMYAEDLDLGWRLNRAGWQTRYEPDARVRHEGAAATSQAWGNERALRWHASTYAWLLRRRGTLVTRANAVINVAGAAVRSALLTPPALIWPGRWGAARRAALGTLRAHRSGLARRSVLERHR